MADRIELVGATRFVAHVNGLAKRAPFLAAQVLRTSAHEIVVPAVQKQLIKNKNVFTGELVARMSARSKVTFTSASVDVGAFGVRYGAAVEYGQGPHSPNLLRIKEYVAKKMGMTGQQGALVTAKIIRTLETRGSMPHPYLLITWESVQRRFWASFIRRMRVHLLKRGL